MNFYRSKTVLSAVAAILVAGTAFFASCEKDVTKNNEIKSEEVDFVNKSTQADYSDYFSYSLSFLDDFYSRCNKAYKTDSNLVIEICNSGDYDKFFNTIGMSQSEVLMVANAIKEEVDYFLEKNPELQNTSSCTSCISESLPRLGGILGETNGDMIVDEYRPECLLCFAECLPTFGNPAIYLICVAACNWMCNA